MEVEKLKERVREAQKNGTAPCSLPVCGGACDECEGRAEAWAEFLGCDSDEVWNL